MKHFMRLPAYSAGPLAVSRFFHEADQRLGGLEALEQGVADISEPPDGHGAHILDRLLREHYLHSTSHKYDDEYTTYLAPLSGRVT